MKANLFLLILSTSFILTLHAQNEKPVIKIEKNLDFGSVEKNADGTREIKFQNTGQTPLIISNIISTCGCTVPSWPKEPINPGDTGSIQVKYDTRRIGTINKQITIVSNATESNIIIQLKGIVLSEPENSFPQKEIDKSSVPVNY